MINKVIEIKTGRKIKVKGARIYEGENKERKGKDKGRDKYKEESIKGKD